MKIIKYTLASIFILVGILIATTLVILGINKYRTSYLTTESKVAKPLLITNVNIIPMNRDTILGNKMVFIKGGIIQAIEDSLTYEGIEIVDAKSGYLIPGLTDMHVHVWDKYELGLYLANGVTAVRNVWGMPMHLRLKEEINNGELISPHFFTTGPKLTGPEFIGDDNLNLTSADEAREKVISYQKRGYDFIKTYYGLTEDLFDAVVEQAMISQMDIVAHPSQKVPFSYHFNKQVISVEHAEDIVQQPLNYQLDTAKLNQVVNDFAGSPHTAFTPTLMAYYNIYKMLTNDNMLESDQVKMMNPAIRKMDSKAQFERWSHKKKENPSIAESVKKQHQFHLLIVKKLNDAGVNIICGTDAGIGITMPGYSIHRELAFYQEAGLTNYEVLKTATANPSRTHQAMHNMGTVEVGKIANLLLTEQNPLNDISVLEKPSTVFVNGEMLSRDDLENFEKHASGRNNFLPTLINYVEYLIVEK